MRRCGVSYLPICAGPRSHSQASSSVERRVCQATGPTWRSVEWPNVKHKINAKSSFIDGQLARFKCRQDKLRWAFRRRVLSWDGRLQLDPTSYVASRAQIQVDHRGLPAGGGL